MRGEMTHLRNVIFFFFFFGQETSMRPYLVQTVLEFAKRKRGK